MRRLARINDWFTRVAVALAAVEVTVILYRAPPLVPAWLNWTWVTLMAVSVALRAYLRRRASAAVTAQVDEALSEYAWAVELSRRAGAISRADADRAVAAVRSASGELVASLEHRVVES